MTHKLGILYLIDKMGGGGAQTHLQALAAGLDPDRFSAEVVCLIRGGISADRLRDQHVPVTILGVSRLYTPSGFAAFRRLVTQLRRLKPDLVHTYLSAANVFGCAAARAAGVRGLITTRRDTGFADGWLMRRALPLTNRWARRVVAVSEDTARIARDREGLTPPQLVTIPNGVDTVRFAPRGRRETVRSALGFPASARVLVSVSHLTPIKGIDVLVEAAPIIKGAIPQATFVVAGRGAEMERITRRIEALGLAADFRLLGAYEDIPGLLEAADLFVLPSRSEGQPNAMMEAMAMGLAVVASRVGGVAEVARQGREALLVDPEKPELLARACVDALTTPDLAARLGRAGRERVADDFSLATMKRRYEELYVQVAGL